MDHAGLPLTIAGDVIVIGPCHGPRGRHSALVQRTLQWHNAPAWTATRAGGGNSAAASVRRATQHLRDSAPGTAAIVHTTDGRIDYLRLPGTGRTRYSGIRTLADLASADLASADRTATDLATADRTATDLATADRTATDLATTERTGIRLATAADGAIAHLAVAAERRAASAEVVARLTTPYTGLFAPGTAKPAPRHGGPSTARLHIIGSTPQHSFGWATDTDTATTHALLAGARILSTRAARAAPAKRRLVTAAGRTELHWLLDGTLQLLAAHTTTPQDRTRIDAAHTALTYRIADLAGDWCIARLVHVSSGNPVATAWGPNPADAIRHATMAADAAAIHDAPAAPAPRPAPTNGAALVSTDAMLQHLGPAELDRLHRDLQHCLARLRLRLLGIRLTTDALLGDPGLTWGVVWHT